MIRQLRRKFVWITMGLLVVVFALALAALNITVNRLEQNRCLEEMEALGEGDRTPRFILSSQEEDPPKKPEEESGGEEPPSDRQEVRHMARLAMKELYLVKLDQTGTVLINSPLFDFGMDEATFNALVEKAMASSRQEGFAEEFLFLKMERSYGTLLIFRSYTQEREAMKGLLLTSLLVGGLGLIGLFFITLWLSRFVTEPAERAFNRQKQFIADASHELKTPLSAIAVNADVLSREIGENKWLANIRQETERMDELVIALLTLARLDAAPAVPKVTFDLSQALTEIALSFDSLAFEKGLNFSWSIAPDLMFTGDPGQLRRLGSILLDNAFSYASIGGNVTMTLAQEEPYIRLRVYNTGAPIDQKDLPHLFERFYRADSARTAGRSFGLGLAIARSIAEAHRGTIRAENQPEGVCFIVQFKI